MRLQRLAVGDDWFLFSSSPPFITCGCNYHAAPAAVKQSFPDSHHLTAKYRLLQGVSPRKKNHFPFFGLFI